MASNGGISYRSEQKNEGILFPSQQNQRGREKKTKYETKLSTCENAFRRTRMETNKSTPELTAIAVPRLVLVHETSTNGWRLPSSHEQIKRATQSSAAAAAMAPRSGRERETRSELTWLVPYDAWEARKSGRFLRRGSEAWEFRKGFGGVDRGTKREWKETVDPPCTQGRREGEQMRGGCFR